MTTTLDKILYTAKAHSKGGRDGSSRTDDGLLDVKLDPPPSMGGKGQGNGAGASGVGAELSRPGLDGSLGVGSVVVMKILLVFKQDIFDLGEPCVFALEVLKCF